MDQISVYYFSGTHWDREWYQDFQGFRMRLVQMTDALLELLENDPDFGVFHFDGQTIVLDDYLEIAPEQKQNLKKFISEGRILIGPWFVMPDEFLLSGESLIANLQLGRKKSREYGAEPWSLGYVCDIFGHIAQMPQIFQGFGIDSAVLGRGTTESMPPYFHWEAPDHSKVTVFRLNDRDGYGDFCQTVYAKESDHSVSNPVIRKNIEKYLTEEGKRINAPVMILMDAIDHAPAEPCTSQYLTYLRQNHPEMNVYHTNLCEAFQELKHYELPTFVGELNQTARFKHGYLHLITYTLSSYYPIKLQNDQCQNLLEKQLQPLMFLGQMLDWKVRSSYRNLAYQYLISNHPHDSICGCSIDQVHKDMEYRFDQVKEICSALREDFLYTISQRLESSGGHSLIVTLFNTLSFERTETLNLSIPFPEDYPAKLYKPFGYESYCGFVILDEKGREVPYQLLSVHKHYRRRIYGNHAEWVDMHKSAVTLTLPALGYRTLQILPSYAPVSYPEMVSFGSCFAENQWIRLEIQNNGELEIRDKKTGRCYDHLCSIVDDGEIGDGWYHVNPLLDREISTKGNSCQISRIEGGSQRVVFRIEQSLSIPTQMLPNMSGYERSSNTVPLRILTDVSLSAGERFVRVSISLFNQSKDHRVRLELPTNTSGNTYFSGQAFYCNERRTGIRPERQTWYEKEPFEKSFDGIVGKRDPKGQGLAFVCPEGLHECACFSDDKQTLMITLLRSVGKPVFTNGQERGQLLGTHTYRFALVPLDLEVSFQKLWQLKDQMASLPLCAVSKAAEKRNLPSPCSFLTVQGKGICVSTIKLPEISRDHSVIIRLYNASDEPSSAEITCPVRKIVHAVLLDLSEEKDLPCDLSFTEHQVFLPAAPWKILTLKLTVS